MISTHCSNAPLAFSVPTKLDDRPLASRTFSLYSRRAARSAATQGRHSSGMKPIIGITPSAQLDTLAHGTFLRYCMSAPYVRRWKPRAAFRSFCRHSGILSTTSWRSSTASFSVEGRTWIQRGTGTLRPSRDVWNRSETAINSKSISLTRRCAATSGLRHLPRHPGHERRAGRNADSGCLHRASWRRGCRTSST